MRGPCVPPSGFETGGLFYASGRDVCTHCGGIGRGKSTGREAEHVVIITVIKIRKEWELWVETFHQRNPRGGFRKEAASRTIPF